MFHVKQLNPMTYFKKSEHMQTYYRRGLIDVRDALFDRRIPKNQIVPEELNHEDRLYTVF